jgi:bifunctional enzyme CysN/CysC
MSPVSLTPHSDARPRFPIVVVGHVDHGKSSLIGRLLNDTGSLPDGKVAELQAASDRRGMPLEWSFALDALQAERDQAVTIDSTQVRFAGADRDYVVVDAPGHREFVRNMLTGAAQAAAAVLVVAADEGIAEQTKRHVSLLPLIGLSQVIVTITKMDLVGFSEARFQEVGRSVSALLASVGLTPKSIIPISIRSGEGISSANPGPAWYPGPPLLDALDRLPELASLADEPPRMAVQAVQRIDDKRILTGRIAAGRLKVGDEVMFSPSNKTARIAAFATWPERNQVEAAVGDSVGLILDRPLFIERGELMSAVQGSLPKLTAIFGARLVWFAPKPLTEGAQVNLRVGTAETTATVSRIARVLDSDEPTVGTPSVSNGEIAEVILRTTKLIALDDYLVSRPTGRFVLFENGAATGAGTISMADYPDQRPLVTVKATNVQAVAHSITAEMRAARHGHRGAVIWFTGLSGAGKSTIAMEAEQKLFANGFEAFVLDGDNLRAGLTANLGFTPDDRSENIRRVGEVAALFASAGMVVLTSLISPYREDRERARAAAERLGCSFHEVYISASLSTCEARDPKGLYKRARTGEIQNFTGVSAPYEPPETPALVLDSGQLGVGECVEKILDYVKIATRLTRTAAS